jgi:Holliday junction resolvasome RuvABC endonuclease subunit
MVAFDPSLTGTGWVVTDLVTCLPVAAGVIHTAPPPKGERRHQTAAQMDGRRGLKIRRYACVVLQTWKPAITAVEGCAGSRNAKAAAALARGQQAVLDAIDELLGAEPVWVTLQAVKKAATGRNNATKDEVEAAMRARWDVDWDALLTAPPPYPERTRPRGEWENAFDAAAVTIAVWDAPAVAALRAMARRRGE